MSGHISNSRLAVPKCYSHRFKSAIPLLPFKPSKNMKRYFPIISSLFAFGLSSFCVFTGSGGPVMYVCYYIKFHAFQRYIVSRLPLGNRCLPITTSILLKELPFIRNGAFYLIKYIIISDRYPELQYTRKRAREKLQC